jgi:hypothetical protein
MASACPRCNSPHFLALLTTLIAVVACSPPSDRGIAPADSSPASEIDLRFDAPLPAAPEALERKERLLLEQAVAAKDPRYFPHVDASGPVLEARDAMRAQFSSSGAKIANAIARETTVALRAVIRGGQRKETVAADPFVEGPEVRFDRGRGVTEWWRSLPSGLEHGITLESRPDGAGRLVLEVGVDAPRIEPRGDDSVAFVDASGDVLALYSQLLVLDADGEAVPSRMGIAGEAVMLEVDDARARYPLVVDPFVTAQEGLLLGSPPLRGSFGDAVSISADGSRALVGAFEDRTATGNSMGTARVLLRVGSEWVEEATLLPLGGVPGCSPTIFVQCHFGEAVSLSADGTRALVGAPRPGAVGTFSGGAWVFVRSGTTWTQEASLVPSDASAVMRFGHSVSLSADGTRALVGAEFGAGGAKVFVRSGATWSQEATLPRPVIGWDANSVSLSADGSRALVGHASDETGSPGRQTGSAKVFIRSGSTWALEATLLPSGGVAVARFGDAVSLSADGSRALVGAPLTQTVAGFAAGSAWSFARAGTAWTQESMLLAPGGQANDNFGSTVSLAANSDRAIVGASINISSQVNTAWVFVRSGSTWSTEAALAATSRFTSFGHSVSLTADGGSAIVGVPRDNTLNGGSARVFDRTGMTWTEQATLSILTNDFIGHSVSLSSDGSRALVGAPLDETPAGVDAGRALVFRREGATWTLETSLEALAARAGDHLGSSVALNRDGTIALVGAPLDDTARGVDAGSVTVFVRTSQGWTRHSTLFASDGAAGDHFGFSVSIADVGNDAGLAIVGASDDDTPGGVDAGSAHVFALSGGIWTQEATLHASDGETGDQFGYSVDLDPSDHEAIVGANGDDTAGGIDAGSARVFRRSGTTWTEEVTLLADDGAANDHFGQSVALRSATALVGADSDDTPDGVDAGSVHVFSQAGTAWTKQATLRAAGGAASDHFGRSVSLNVDGTRAAVGAYADDTSAGADAGSVRIFGRVGTTWMETLTLHGSDSSLDDRFGYAVSLAGDGTRALIGAPGDDVAPRGPIAGSATVHTITWSPGGAVVLISPSGTVATSTPTYVWRPEPSSLQYRLWVNDSGGKRVDQVYTASQVGCADGVTNCRVTPATQLAPGGGQFYVQGQDTGGGGPWGSGMAFTVAGPAGPTTAPTPLTPNDTVATSTPTYTWTSVTGATQYDLYVTGTSGVLIQSTTTAGTAGCDSGGTGNCSFTPSQSLYDGAAKWWVRAANAQNPGPWSVGQAFTVAGSGSPGLITLTSPSGPAGTNNPTYVWQAAPAATEYHLWVQDSVAKRVDVVLNAATLCSGATCSYFPNSVLSPGNGRWWVQGKNASGPGPWGGGVVFSVP